MMHVETTNWRQRKAEVLAKISYPLMRKRSPPSEPIVSDFSRKLLADYHASVDKDRQLRTQLTVQSSAASRRPTIAPSTTMLIEGERALQGGKHSEALSCFLEAVRMGESSAELFTKIAGLFRHKGQTSEALDYYTKAIALDPNQEANYLCRAECFLDIDSPGEAFTEFEKFFKLTNPPKSLIVRCGKAALDADLLKEAEHYLQLVLSKTDEADVQTDAYAWYNLGELAERKNEDDVAKEHYRNVCRCDPTFSDPYQTEAEEELAAKNFSLALHLFEAVAKMKPDDAFVFTRLADVYSQLGDEFSSSVLSCLTRAIELAQPGDAMLEDVLVKRGRLILHSDEDDAETRAIADFSLCLDVNPNNSDALESRGWALQARSAEGDLDASAVDYTLLVSLPDVEHTRKGYPYRCLAVRACQRGEYADAAKLFAYAGVCGEGLTEEDSTLMYLATAHAASQVENFDEQYEPRPTQHKEVEKGSKKVVEQPKPYPVVSLSYHLTDTAYQQLREREPTVHSEKEYAFIQTWKPYRESIERHKEDMDAVRMGKKAGKRK